MCVYVYVYVYVCVYVCMYVYYMYAYMQMVRWPHFEDLLANMWALDP